MADADVDGAHIATLNLTLFFRYMRPMITAGYVYVAMPPLYRLKWTKGPHDFVYTDAERDRVLAEGKAAGRQLPKGEEVIRDPENDYELSLRQLKCGFDYDAKFWGSGNYRLHADKIRCSALIVQGLNDENVSTKQFEMMVKAFQKSGQTYKTILHQGPHITPTMPNKNYGILIDGKFYDDIVNEWISHYLYGVENHAEEMPILACI